LELKKVNPHMNIYILYRDIRTYGEREYKYKEARERGIIFIRYSSDRKPDLSINENRLIIHTTDHVLERPLKIETDLVVLATAILPNKDEVLARFFKVPLNDDGFFVEKHAKLGPSDFATEGVFVCGLAHSPKPLDEAIAQGLAAASRAVTILSKERMLGNALVSEINPEHCRGCRTCIDSCPYQAIDYLEEQRRCQVNPATCKGCGACASVCPTGAAMVGYFTDDILLDMVQAMSMA
jgi:heterodisulfide reductase subunit A